MNRIHFFFNKIGLDRAIGFTILSRVIQSLGSLVSIVLISRVLSSEEQGYYYTFGSIVALQVFFELGLNFVITQFVAHEVAHLSWVSNSKIDGNATQLSRLSSLLHLCIKTFSFLGFFLLLTLIVSGFIFFNYFGQNSVSVKWVLPWILVCISTTLMFVINPVYAFLEGLGKIKEVSKIRFFQQTASIITLIIVIGNNGKLYTLALSSMASFIVLACGILFSHYKPLLFYIHKLGGIYRINYWREIFPFQYKISISWISGYFIFQLFNPVLFATAGPKIAGQMGMTLQVLNGISLISMSWITTKAPFFSTLISKKLFSELDILFNRTVLQLLPINIFLSFVFILVLFLSTEQISDRFLGVIPVLILSLTGIVNQFIFSLATYLRCHKVEPFLINSVVGSILILISTLVLGSNYSVLGMVVGYSFITVIIGLPWSYIIFLKQKKILHFQ